MRVPARATNTNKNHLHLRAWDAILVPSFLARVSTVFNVFQNTFELHHSEPSLQRNIPADPRARNLIRRFLGQRSIAPRRLRTARWRREQTETLDALYWLLRWARPSRVKLSGCPEPGQLLLIAAAIADAGGKRMIVERMDSDVDDQLWPLIADAGLDWLVRLEDGSSAQACDCRILAGSAAVRAHCDPDLNDGRNRARLVIGLTDDSDACAGDDPTLGHRLMACGYHPIVPPRPGERFWAAVHID